MAAESSESEEPWTYSRVDTEIKLLDKHYEAAQEVARRKHQLDADEARKGMQDAARAWSARGDVPQDARDMLFNLLQENLHHALELLDHSLETTIRDLKQGKDRESTKAWTKLAPVTKSSRPSSTFTNAVIAAAASAAAASHAAAPKDATKATDDAPSPAAPTAQVLPAPAAPELDASMEEEAPAEAVQDQDTPMEDAPPVTATPAAPVPATASDDANLNPATPQTQQQQPSTELPQTEQTPQSQTPSLEKGGKRKVSSLDDQDVNARAKKSKTKLEIPDHPLTDRHISFGEVYQNGNALYKHTIVKYGPYWYILKCDEHGVHFRKDAVTAAAKHLDSEAHGNQRRMHTAAVEKLGFLVVDCNAELAEKHNRLVDEAFANGYRPLNPMMSSKKSRKANKDDGTPSKAPGGPGSSKTMPAGSKLAGSKRSREVITDPIPGELYMGKAKPKYPGDKPQKYIIMVLAWKDLGICGRAGETLGASALLRDAQRKTCYTYDQDGISGWAPGYEDGGRYVQKRWFPIVWFEGLNDRLGWIRAEEITPYTAAVGSAKGRHNAETRARAQYDNGRKFLKAQSGAPPHQPVVMRKASLASITAKERALDAENKDQGGDEGEDEGEGEDEDKDVEMDVDTSTDEDSEPEPPEWWTGPPIVVDDSDDADYVGDADDGEKSNNPPRRSTQGVRPAGNGSGSASSNAEVTTPQRAGHRSTDKRETQPEQTASPSRQQAPFPSVELGSPIMEMKSAGRSKGDEDQKPSEKQPQQPQQPQQQIGGLPKKPPPVERLQHQIGQLPDKPPPAGLPHKPPPAGQPERMSGVSTKGTAENHRQQPPQKKQQQPQAERTSEVADREPVKAPDQAQQVPTQQPIHQPGEQPGEQHREQPQKPSQHVPQPHDQTPKPTQLPGQTSKGPARQSSEEGRQQPSKRSQENQHEPASEQARQRPEKTPHQPEPRPAQQSKQVPVEQPLQLPDQTSKGPARQSAEAARQQPVQQAKRTEPQSKQAHQRPEKSSHQPEPRPRQQPQQVPVGQPVQLPDQGLARQSAEAAGQQPLQQPAQQPKHTEPQPEPTRQRPEKPQKPSQNATQPPDQAQPQHPPKAPRRLFSEEIRQQQLEITQLQEQARQSQPSPKQVAASAAAAPEQPGNGTALAAPRQGRVSPIESLLNPAPNHATGILGAQALARQAQAAQEAMARTNGHGPATVISLSGVNVATPAAEDRWRVVRNSPAISSAVSTPDPSVSSRTASPLTFKHDSELGKPQYHIAGYKEGNGDWRVFPAPVKLAVTEDEDIVSGEHSGFEVVVNRGPVTAVQFNADPDNTKSELVVWSGSEFGSKESRQHFLFNGGKIKAIKFQRWVKKDRQSITQRTGTDKISP